MMADQSDNDYVVLLCKHSLDTLVIKVLRSGVFEDLLRIVTDNWHLPDVSKVSLSYSVPGHPRCFLRNDCELQSMFFLIDALALKFVEVSVGVAVAVAGSVSDDVDVTNEVEHVDGVLSGQVLGEYPGIPTGQFCIGSQASSSRSLLSSDWSNALSSVGQVFYGGVSEFRRALCRYSVELGFQFVYVKNHEKKVVAVCSEKWEHSCKWCVRATMSSVNGSFIVRKFVGEHSCGLVFDDSRAKRLSYTIVAELIVDQLRVNPQMKTNDVVNMFRSNYGFDLPYRKALRALDKAKGMIYGDALESFMFLHWYSDMTMVKNPGSHFVVDVNSETRRFRRMFVSYNASIRGFNHCRPLLFVDGTFLKGRYKGVILAATGKDGNQGLFPLALAVVDSESQDNWCWFLMELKKVVDTSRTITFVSDRNPGLLESIAQVFSGHNHFYCLQHLKSNLRDRFKGTSFNNSFREHVVWLFRECAHAPSESSFISKLENLKKAGGSIVDRFLEGLPLERWTNAFANGCRYGEMSSNAAESFNAWILDVRDLPITHMIDSIRAKLMSWFAERRERPSGWSGLLCPRMLERFQSFVSEGRTWKVKRSSDSIFEVLSVPSVSVDVVKRTCSCCMWELGGFPCVHAAVVVTRYSFPVQDMVERYFLVESYSKTYAEVIYPVPSPILNDFVCDEDNMILAPSTRRQPGRPRKRRFRSSGEVVRRVRCGRCGKIGNHNKKTCKEPLN